MNSYPRHKFSILNSCDGLSFTATHVVIDITGTVVVSVTSALGAAVGNLIWVLGFDGKLTGLQTITAVDAGVNTITFAINPAGLTSDAVTKINAADLVGSLTIVSWREVTPLNFYNTIYEWKRDGASVRYRKALKGALKFQGTDWNYFRDNVLGNPCCEVLFKIEKKCSGAWVQDWRGYFTHNMGAWDLSHCWVEFTMEIDDAYRCIERNKTKKHNVLLVADPLTVTIEHEISFEEQTCCTAGGFLSNLGTFFSVACGKDLPQTLSPFDTDGTIRDFMVDESCIDDKANWYLKSWNATARGLDIHDPSDWPYDICTTWVRETSTTLDVGGVPNPPPGSGWTLDTATTLAGAPATKWWRIPFGRNNVNYDTLLFENIVDCDYNRIVDTIFNTDETEYTRFRSFPDVFSYMVGNTCNKLAGIRSDFFEINPPGDTPGYVAGTNYVDGAVNKPANMALEYNADFIDPTASDGASIGEMSFDEWINALCEIFNLDWFIDADNYLRIEHKSWFQRTVAFDSTIKQRDNWLLNKGRKAFSFKRSEIPVREEYTFFAQGNIDFKGTPISYPPPCPDETQVVNHATGPISTDVRYIQNNPADISKTGFVLIVLDPDDLTHIDQEVGRLTGDTWNNAHLSWANLHYAYHRHLRPLLQGNMNGVNETFISAVRTKLQANIKYAGDCCTEINPLRDLVTTELGDGQIDKISKSNQDEVYSLELLQE